MTITYTLWDAETRNAVAWFDTEEEALAAVRETLRADGRALAETLLLGKEDEAGQPALIAAGAALIERAEAASSHSAATT